MLHDDSSGSPQRSNSVSNRIHGDAIMNIRTSLIAGLGLLAASGLAAQAQMANTPAAQPPTATNGNAQPGMTSPSGMPQSSNADNASASSANGMSSQDVKALQEALKGQGANVKSDGVWGPSTQAALKRYQQQNGLPVTGQLDQATRSKLNLQG
jgi:peptidoglycan hydrolase-like protein with peptidoglycan-binding domain